MDARLSTNRKFKRMFVNILSVFVILAMALPSVGSVSAQEPAPRIVVQITDDWFRAENFLPNTSLDYWIYDAPAGNLLMGSGTMPTDGSGTVTTWVGNRVNLQPGQYIVVADSSQEKTLVLEDLTFDLFDITNGHLEGTAPAPDGRDVWTGIGFENNMWDESVTTGNGNWSVDFGQAVPAFAWVAAQIFDEDGDASEVRPQQIFGQWIAIYTLDLPPGAWAEGDHSYYLGDNRGSQGDPVSLSVSGQAQYYEGYVLLRGRAMWAGGDNGCVNVSSIHPAQATRFHSGWPTESPMTYDQAVNYFSGLSPWVVRDDGEQTNLELYEIGLYFPETWPQYYCTFTKIGWPNPHFSAFPEQEYIEGWNWPLGANIHLTIDDPSTEANPDFEQDQPVVVTPWNPDDKWVTFNFASAYDMKPGDVVTLSDGLILRTLTVHNLDVTQAEISDDTVYGTAEPGAVVYAWVHDHGESEMVVTAGENGTWMAEFWKTGLDMVAGMCGRSEIRNDMGNATAVDWCYPVPHITAFPEQNIIEGTDWHPNAYVYLSIDRESAEEPVSFLAQAKTEPMPWDSNRWWVRFDLTGQFDLMPGDTVHLDDDSVERTMIVRNLTVTNVDPVANVVGGTAPPGSEVQVWPHETGQQLQATVGNSRNWQVDFTGTFDLVPGTCGRSQILDGFDNATAVDWCAPKPWLVAFPENDAVEGWEWPDGATVTLTINNAPGLEWSGIAAVTTWGDPRTFVRIEFGNDYNLQIGDKVTLTDEFGTTRTHLVQELAVTEANGDTDTVSGTANIGAIVQVWPHGTDYFIEDTVEDGTWTANFGALGFHTIEETGGRSQIVIDGNATAVDWNASWPPTTFTVNTTDDNDDGTCDEVHCSLREAIRIANERIVADVIVFDIPGTPPFTIQPQSGYSDITDPLTIDATTQPGYAGSPVIELDGTYAGDGTNGFVIWANESTVRGLAINRFSGNGMVVFGSGNTIRDNYLGTDVTGTTTAGPAGTPVDMPIVTVMDACPAYPVGTDIDGFVSESEDPLAPWSGTSVHFRGTEVGCDSPEQMGNASLIYRYKLEFADVTPLESITVSGAAFNGPDNILRLLDEDMGVLGSINTFGGNSFVSPFLKLQDVEGTVFYLDEFDTSSHWRYRQNIVINGPIPLGNHGSGVLLAGGATDNQVIDNLISGNMENGVAIFNPGTTGNVVQENKIGTDSTGTQALGNRAPGIGIGDQAYNNFIIGNLISGNRSDGVAIFNPGTDGNTLQGNNIGTDIDREVAIPNQGVGVWIGEGASNTVIGGDNASVRNVISGNRWGGVSINHVETTGTIVQGNYIGTNKNGDVALPNGGDGVYISGSENVIGGSEPGAENVISGNTASGVSMAWGATDNLIQGNFIGTDVSGTAPLHSTSGPEVGHYDLDVLPETCPTYEAGTSRDAFVSASNDPLAPWDGISVMFMGTDEDKCGVPETFEDAPLIYRYKLTFDEPTELTSIAVTGAAFNGGALRVLDENMEVLGTAYNFGGNSFQTNYVRLSGVVGQVFFIEEYDYSSDWRYRESIVINGPLPVGNLGSGVNFNNAAANNLVLDNLISGNRSDAVSLYHTGTDGNILQGNYIGTDVSGTAAVPNTSAAIWIGEGASNTVIGGIEEGQGNLVSGNTGDAISINNAETTGTVIQGNFIGTDVTGSVTLPNNSNGIVLVTGTHDNLIGGTEPGAGNVISGNFGDGVLLVDGGTSGNSVQNNFIGTDLTGTMALGNWNRGVYLGGGAADNLISGNIISGNGAAGIRLADSGTTGNQIQRNFIGTDITGLNPLGNGYFGVRITDGAGDNLIGGKETGAGNVIAFNGDSGIALNPEAGFGNALLSNQVFSNGGFGIDLAEDGVTPNDVLDQDSGPNRLQNYPYIVAVTRMSTFVKITGLLVTAPNMTYRVEFFSNNSCDPSGFGEGQTFLGYTVIQPNPVGIANFRVNLPVVLANGAFITATATDAAGNTSEFSQCFGPIK